MLTFSGIFGEVSLPYLKYYDVVVYYRRGNSFTICGDFLSAFFPGKQGVSETLPERFAICRRSVCYATVGLDFGPFRVRFGPFRVRFGSVSGPFRVRFGVVGWGRWLGSGWGRGEWLL